MKIVAAILIFLGASTVLAQEQAPTVETTPLGASIRQDLDQNNYPAAEEKLKQYLSKNPGDYTALYTLGMTVSTEGKYLESIKYLDEARAIKEKNNVYDPSIYNALGWSRFLAGDTVGAERDIKRALELSEGSEPKLEETALNNLGLVYLYTNQPQKAKSQFEQAITKYNSEYGARNLNLVTSMQQKLYYITKETLERMSRAYFEAWRDADQEKMLSFYDFPMPRFFGKRNASRDFVEKDLNNYFSIWSERNAEIIRISHADETPPLEDHRMTVVLRFHFTKIGGGETRGITTTDVIWKNVDGAWKIKQISETLGRDEGDE